MSLMQSQSVGVRVFKVITSKFEHTHTLGLHKVNKSKEFDCEVWKKKIENEEDIVNCDFENGEWATDTESTTSSSEIQLKMTREELSAR